MLHELFKDALKKVHSNKSFGIEEHKHKNANISYKLLRDIVSDLSPEQSINRRLVTLASFSELNLTLQRVNRRKQQRVDDAGNGEDSTDDCTQVRRKVAEGAEIKTQIRKSHKKE